MEMHKGSKKVKGKKKFDFWSICWSLRFIKQEIEIWSIKSTVDSRTLKAFQTHRILKKSYASSSSSSNSPSSSAVSSWYCWYSLTKSFMLDSASVNSISSIPSPVYQCKKAFLRNIAVNCSEILLKSSWIAVELPTKVADIFKPRGGISQTAVFTLFGIHSTK